MLPPPGAKEVLVYQLAGEDPPTRVRAVLLGSRFDTRALGAGEFLDPGDPRVRVAGAAFVFRYGAVVLFGVSAAAEAEFLDHMRGIVAEKLDTPEFDMAGLEINPEIDEQVDARGTILLKELSAARAEMVATVLARSVLLARDEARVGEVLERIEPLAASLQRRGKTDLRIRPLMRQIGDVLIARHRMVGRAQVSERPDVLWDHPSLERLYSRLEAEYELGDRSRALAAKLELIGDIAETLLDLVQDKRSTRIEIAIVALITFELALSIWARLA